MPDKLRIFNRDGSVSEVEPLKLWTPGDFSVHQEQEDFFDAVRRDKEMTDEQKSKWLALEEQND